MHQGQIRDAMEDKAKSEPISLLGLAPEIQTKIFSHLVVSFEKPTIQAVLLTCKRLYEVALPLSVSVFRNTAPYLEGGGPCSRARNVQFLRYILISKPELSKYVNTVVLGSFSSGSGSAENNEHIAQSKATKSTEEEFAVYQQTVETGLNRLNFGKTSSWCTEWVEDLKQGYSDAHISLILLVCPNIRTLLFEQPTEPRQFLRLLRVVGSLRNSTPLTQKRKINQCDIPLSKLQDVFHETNDLQKGYDTFYEQAPILFNLPHLRFYECNLADGGDKAAEGFGRLQPRSCPVEEIFLRCSTVTGPTVLNMLKACKALKKFEYTQYSFWLAPERIMPHEFPEALLLHANTLEDLYINMEEDWDKGWEWKDHPERLYMGISLCQLHSLKRLTISMQCLTGILAGQPENSTSYAHAMPLEVEEAPSLIECLPESLEYLKIISCGEEIWEKATELLRTVEQGRRFTKLTYIGFLFNGWLMKSTIELRCYAPHVRLDIGYQEWIVYTYDLGQPAGETETRGAHNRMSRIHAADIRRRYLDIRGLTEYPHGSFEEELFQEELLQDELEKRAYKGNL